MASFNRVILLGNITRDIEVKYLQSGMAVAEIGLAVNDRQRTRRANGLKRRRSSISRSGAGLRKSPANT